MKLPKFKNKLWWRYAAIAAVFAVGCGIYLVTLGKYSFAGRDEEAYREYDIKSFSYTVTVPAVRGNLCDRNGKIIATNKKAWSVNFDYWSMPADKDAANHTILVALEALSATGATECRTRDYFPFEGTYPDLTLNPSALEEGTALCARFSRVKARRSFKEEMTPEEIVLWYAKKFGLLDQKGKPLYSPEEMTELLRVRYNMDACDFGAYAGYVLAQDVPLETVEYIREKDVMGLTFPGSTEREYTYPGYMSHILGSVGAITAETADEYRALGYPMDATVGVSGLEKVFENYLHGTDGVRTVVEDEDGNVIDTYMTKEPVAGLDVYLTIDMDLQVAAEDSLREFAEKYSENETSGGALVALDPANGGILVMASYPTYNLLTFNADYNDLVQDPDQPLVNRALNGLYTPGSTFKLNTAIAGLETGSITQSFTVNCTGVYTRFADYQMKCWVYPDRHGVVNVVTAIENSCNVFFAETGYLTGIDALNRYASAFGLGKPTGVELGELIGTLAGKTEREKSGGAWYAGDTIQAAIGQSENRFTILQIANYVAALTDGGTRYSAHLLDSVRAYYTKEKIESYTPTVADKIAISSSSLSAVKKGMYEVVNGSQNNTIKNYMAKLPVKVGGKTGTAQVGTENDNGLFVCTAPWDDPDIVIAAVIEGSNSGRYTAGVAAAVLNSYYHVK